METPSIRVVPLGRGASLDWPFPRQERPCSQVGSATAAERQDTTDGDTVGAAPDHRAPATGTGVLSGGGGGGGGIGQDADEPAEYSRRSSAQELFPQPTTEILMRPLTPTLYSVPRKVSEVHSLADDADVIARYWAEQQHQSPLRQSSRCNVTAPGSATFGRLSGLFSVRPHDDNPGPAHAITVSQAVSSKIQSPFTPNAAVPRAQSSFGIVDGTNSANAAINHEIPVDLESLRRGPRLRYPRLPPKPRIPGNSVWDIPRATRELWGAMGRLRGLLIAEAVLWKLSSMSFVSSMTVVIVRNHNQGTVGEGVVAWAVLSGLLFIILPIAFWLTILQYRKTGRAIISDKAWIEMHHWSKPLPPCPPNTPEEEEKDNDCTTPALGKVTQDQEQLRREFELLRGRIGALEEGQQQGHRRENDAANSSESTPAHKRNNTDDDTGHNTNRDTTGARARTMYRTPSPRRPLRPDSQSPTSSAIPQSFSQDIIGNVTPPDVFTASPNSSAIPRSFTQNSTGTVIHHNIFVASPSSSDIPQSSTPDSTRTVIHHDVFNVGEDSDSDEIGPVTEGYSPLDAERSYRGSGLFVGHPTTRSSPVNGLTPSPVPFTNGGSPSSKSTRA